MSGFAAALLGGLAGYGAASGSHYEGEVKDKRELDLTKQKSKIEEERSARLQDRQQKYSRENAADVQKNAIQNMSEVDRLAAGRQAVGFEQGKELAEISRRNARENTDHAAELAAAGQLAADSTALARINMQLEAQQANTDATNDVNKQLSKDRIAANLEVAKLGQTKLRRDENGSMVITDADGNNTPLYDADGSPTYAPPGVSEATIKQADIRIAKGKALAREGQTAEAMVEFDAAAALFKGTSKGKSWDQMGQREQEIDVEQLAAVIAKGGKTAQAAIAHARSINTPANEIQRAREIAAARALPSAMDEPAAAPVGERGQLPTKPVVGVTKVKPTPPSRAPMTAERAAATAANQVAVASEIKAKDQLIETLGKAVKDKNAAAIAAVRKHGALNLDDLSVAELEAIVKGL